MKAVVHHRNHTLDVIRIVAVLAVVLIHCSAPFLTGYKPHMAEFLAGNIADSIARVGVPFFLMISGALFLDERKEITLKGILSKNVKTVAVITIVWAVIYAVVYFVLSPFAKGAAIDRKAVMDGILNGHGHMWYLYMIMGLYVITPFLKYFVCTENKKLVLVYIAISFVVEFLVSTVDQVCMHCCGTAFLGDLADKFHLDFFGGYIAYYLVGWYIVHIGIKRKYLRYLMYFTGICALVFMIVYTQLTGDYLTAYADIGAPVFLYAVGMFLLLNTGNFAFKGKTAQFITGLSKLSFGVYIVHVLVISVFIELFPYREHCFVYLPVCFVSVACASFLGVYVASKIPLVKKLIKM